MNNPEIICPNCEKGTVALRRIAGRKEVAIPGVEVELPADLELPTCNVCLDYSVPESAEEAVSLAIQERFRHWQRSYVDGLVRTLCDRHQVTRRRVAAALDVTASYLSNIVAGDKAASSMLLRLLRAFVVAPDEFKVALEGKPLDRFRYGPTHLLDEVQFLSGATLKKIAAIRHVHVPSTLATLGWSHVWYAPIVYGPAANNDALVQPSEPRPQSARPEWDSSFGLVHLRTGSC